MQKYIGPRSEIGPQWWKPMAEKAPFILHLRSPDPNNGTRVKLLYDPHRSQLTELDGSHLRKPDGEPLFQRIPVSHGVVPHRIRPDDPGKKSAAPRKLKISLGMSCNASCSYCLQAAHVTQAPNTSTADAKIFLETLDSWLEGEPEQIEFWGGEPLLYWHKVRVLAPALRRKFPKAKFLIITNGTLLTEEIVEEIEALDFGVGISHDGPGQHVRGYEIVDDPNFKALAKRLIDQGRMSFNAVLTPASHDVDAVIDWFQDRFGEQVPVSFEGVVHDYENPDDDSAVFTEDQLREFSERLAFQIARGTALRSPMIAQKVNGFLQSLQQSRPSYSLGQKCGMDREDTLAVDLLGKVSTCQNVGSESEHYLGHVRSFDKIANSKAWHWSHREECSSCPVLQLCSGSCMYQDGDGWKNSCNNEYAFNIGIFTGALFHLTGFILDRIEGEMIRP